MHALALLTVLARADVPCGLALTGPPPPLTLEALPAPPSGDLWERDAFGEFPNRVRSEHFVVKWGPNPAFSPADVAPLIEGLETGWDLFVEGRGYAPPTEVEHFYFNVYIGDTGGDAPSANGAGGYYWVDPVGHPMIVVAQESLWEPDVARLVGVHEWHHALQHVFEAYYEAPWFWEATADWAVNVALPDNPYRGAHVAGYTLYPHYPLTFQEDVPWEDPASLHAYGAFLFLVHLAGAAPDTDVIHDVWDAGDWDHDPEAVLRWLLPERGLTFEDVWLDHHARVVTWDYPDGAHYEEWARSWSDGDGLRVAGVSSGVGEPTWTRIPPSEAPHDEGAVYLRYDAPARGTLHVEIEGEVAGSAGSPVGYGARVIAVRGAAAEALPVPFVGARGALAVPVDDVDRVWIVVGAWRTAQVPWESSYPFRYRAYVGDLPDEPPVPGPGGSPAPRACGCGVGGAPSGLIVPVVLALARRRRGRNRDRRAGLARPR